MLTWIQQFKKKERREHPALPWAASSATTLLIHVGTLLLRKNRAPELHCPTALVALLILWSWQA
jgi:hypothetical protein